MNITEKLTNLRSKITGPYIYVAILFLGILLSIIAMIFVFSTSNATKQSSNNAPQTAYGTLRVNSKVDNVQFLFNNQVYYAPTTINHIVSGSYSVTSVNSGYKDESYAVTIVSDKTSEVSLKMEALTPAEVAQTGQDEKEESLSEADQTKQELEIRAKNYPLTTYLPEVIGSVMLDYDVNDNGSVQYVVRALPGTSYDKTDYQGQINDFLQSKGFDPASISILWE